MELPFQQLSALYVCLYSLSSDGFNAPQPVEVKLALGNGAAVYFEIVTHVDGLCLRGCLQIAAHFPAEGIPLEIGQQLVPRDDAECQNQSDDATAYQHYTTYQTSLTGPSVAEYASLFSPAHQFPALISVHASLFKFYILPNGKKTPAYGG
jgi:hypothetical protein